MICQYAVKERNDKRRDDFSSEARLIHAEPIHRASLAYRFVCSDPIMLK